MEPEKVRLYLQRAFRDSLGAAEEAMRQLAESMSPDDVAKKGYDMYTEFRCASLRLGL